MARKKIRLGDICDILNGYAFKSDKYVSEGIRIIRIANVQKGYLEDSMPQYYPLEASSELHKYMLEEGDLLMSLTGNVGRVACLPANLLPAALNQRVACLRLKDSVMISKDFLFQFLNSDYFESQCILSSKGIAQINMSTEWLKEYEIPFFSPKEQQKISSELSRIDALIALEYKQLAKLDELVKARFVELFGDPETNPMGWKCVTVQQAIKEKIIDKPLDGNHGGKHPKTSDYVPKGVPFIMANNLVDGRVDMEHCAFITKKQADSLDKGFAKDGDVLITHKGTIGRTAILHCTYPYIMLTPQVTYYRPITGIIPEYLKAYFDTDYFQGVIGNVASVGSTRAYIGITAQQELPLLIPAMERQREYATFVEQTDKSKLAVQQSIDQLETLKKSLMQQYFG